jgi:uncharacterized membrane protein
MISNAKKITFSVLILICISLISLPPVLAQDETTVVRAVFFYSPTCPHCHEVIDNVLPPLVEQYGPQLMIIAINTQTNEGQAMYQSMVDHFELGEDRLGVPALVVSETHLLGSEEIPQLFPDMIKEGLELGGIAWPTFPGMNQVLSTSLPGSGETAQAEDLPEALITQPIEREDFENQSVLEQFKRDPVGNSASVIVLIAMIVSTLIVVFRSDKKTSKERPWLIWVIPSLSVIGILVAGYMTFVEVTHTDAICGPVGDCNTVQQSPYAMLFGVLPLGVLGLIGYIAILISWALLNYGPDKWQSLAVQALWGIALFGTLFSIYLTYLEPFVIGATCIWCLTSAILMTLLLWVSTDVFHKYTK